ncbi:MAG: DUF3553 domain-containing protein, partial [Alphaproteobacteria bacterium]|nr:DUF3553 domain-containing protein [Alphaproteobacteria bacterium]
PGWEEGQYPHQRALEEGGAKGLEEERRHAYVGLTRARRRVTILHAANRRVYGQWLGSLPSSFIGELPEEHVETRSHAGPGSWGFAESSTAWGGRWDKPRAAGSWEKREDPGDSFRKGERVFHQKFGYGVVQEVDGDKLTIHFDHAGQKRVVGGFVAKA